MKLRPPQQACCSAVYRDLKGLDSVLAACATGVGKTIIAAALFKRWVDHDGYRCLFLAHREELINQAVHKLNAARGLDADIEKAEHKASDMSQVVVGSVQSMQGKRLESWPRDHFDVIITDEAHRSTATTYRNIYDHFNTAKRLGITATAYRQKGSLSDIYQKVSYEYNLRQAIDDGLLCRIVAQTIPLPIELGQLKTSQGDYDAKDLHTKIEPYLEAIADEIWERSSRRKIIIFLPLCATAKKFKDILASRGFKAFYADGKDRSGIKGFEDSGSGSALCNAMLCTEGYDHPEIDCVIVLRPTRSTGLYSQMIGRGTRLKEDGGNCLVLDFLWHSSNHDLCKPSCLVADTDEIAEKMNEIQDRKSGSSDLKEIEDEAKTELREERERRLADNLKSFVGNKSKKFDPVLESLAIYDDKLTNWLPKMEWEKGEILHGQKKFLDKMGFDSNGWTRGYASTLIGDLEQRRKSGLCTPKQMRTLLKNGVAGADALTFQQASEQMDKLSKKWDKAKRWKQIKNRR